RFDRPQLVAGGGEPVEDRAALFGEVLQVVVERHQPGEEAVALGLEASARRGREASPPAVRGEPGARGGEPVTVLEWRHRGAAGHPARTWRRSAAQNPW